MRLACDALAALCLRKVCVAVEETGIGDALGDVNGHFEILMVAYLHSVAHADLERKVRVELS